MELEILIARIREGDLAAYGTLVEMTQQMVVAVCFRILRDHFEALDAAQETYLRAFGRLKELRDPTSFPGWLRRIAVTTARDQARKRRFAFMQMADIPDVPVLDDLEDRWSESQRQALARALLGLDQGDRRICDRFYHGGWGIARIAADAGISEGAMRKRLQRIRDQLREDAEMSEQQQASGLLPANLPAQIVELLARPKLVDLPENPVGRMTEMLKARYSECRTVDVPEIVHISEARRVLGPEPHHLPSEFIHMLDSERFLRYDTTLPLLIAARNRSFPLRLSTAGQVYRNQSPTPTRDQSFHQFEVLALDEKAMLDPWHFMGATMHVVADLLPGRTAKIEPVEFPGCARAWEIGVDVEGKWIVVLSWGIYADSVVQYLGGDPERHAAFGLGYGLERMAALHFGFDDIRKLASARVQT